MLQEIKKLHLIHFSSAFALYNGARLVLIFSLRKFVCHKQLPLYVDGACRGNPGLGDGARTLLQKLKNINCVAVKTTPPITVWNSPRPLKAFFLPNRCEVGRLDRFNLCQTWHYRVDYGLEKEKLERR